MKKNKMITIICLVIAVLSILGYFGIKYYLDKDLEKQRQQLEDQKEKIGSVEKETVETSVAKFNTQIIDKTKWKTLPVNDDNLIIHENTYWYYLYEDIALVVTPQEFSNDKTKDITNQMTIYIPIDSEYQDNALEYAKYLIKSNNDKINDQEVDNLLNEARELQKDRKKANNGKGIYVGIFENSDHLEYQVSRIYK